MKPLFELKITKAAPGSRKIANHLSRQLRAAILDGRLPAGCRLPATRDAQAVFGVSRNTAQDVYDQLSQDGLLASRRGSGTFVRAARAVAIERPSEYVGQESLNPYWKRDDIASWIGFWHERQESQIAVPVVADLRPALVDQRLFPHAVFRRVMARRLRQLETSPPFSRSPQGNQGNGQLRRAIAGHLGITRAVSCQPEDVLVTSGAQQAFDLIARALVVPGQTTVAVEDPGYPPMRVPFAAAGANLAPVPVDAEGIVVEAIPLDAKIICVCPSHQYPLGMPMSARRRAALSEFARTNGAVIIEDDYDGEFRYDDAPLEALRRTSADDHVFYVGSFSKCIFPAIRLGFIVAPRWALPSLTAVKNSTDWHTSIPIQTAVASFIEEGHLSRHVSKIRRIYRDRRKHLLQRLEETLGELLEVVPSFYGMHISAIARGEIDCEAISTSLAARGVLIHSLERYHLGAAIRSGFILSYASSSLDELDHAVSALSCICKQRADLT